MMTHETYIQAVRAIAVARLGAEDRAKVDKHKLTYGVGKTMLRGVTFFESWSNGTPKSEALVEICAAGEESVVQLAGTTIHELGHVLAGFEGGHGKPWKEACAKLGLRRVQAAGTHYTPAHFAPDVRLALAALEPPSDGAPALINGHANPMSMFVAMPRPAGFKPRPCGSTHGAKGGKSRGTGSGSRLLKASCPSEACSARDGDKAYTLRITRKWADVGLPACPACEATLKLDS